MKTSLALFFLLTLLSLNTLAQEFPHTLLEVHENDERIFSISFNPNGSVLATGGWGQMSGFLGISNEYPIRLWSANTKQLLETFQGHTDDVTSLAFSPDGSILASGSRDDTIHVWYVNTGELLETFQRHSDDVTSVVFSPDGRTLASGSEDDTIRLWNVELELDTGPILWDLETGQQVANTREEVNNTQQLLKIFEGHKDKVNSITFSPDGRTLASGSVDGTVRLWDVNTGQETRTITTDNDSVESLVFSPDAMMLAGGTSAALYLWDANTGQLLKRLQEKQHYFDDVADIAFSPDGRTLASSTRNRGIHLWDANTGQLLKILRESASRVSFSPNGLTLASLSDDTTIRLWEIPSTHVSITPSVVESPAIGKHFAINIRIDAGKNVAGYEVTIGFEATALRYVGSANGDYLSSGAFFVPGVISENQRWDPLQKRYVSEDHKVTLGATSLTGVSNGDGTLATLTFEVIDSKESILVLSNVILTDSDGELLPNLFSGGVVTDPQIGPEDVNRDGVINILDLVKVAARFGQTAEGPEDVNRDGVVNIVDLVKVAGALGAGAAAPSLHPQALATFTAADVQKWLTQAQQVDMNDAISQRGIRFLEQLLAALIPKETALLVNYPNPFNPETWIPYQLAEPADVTLTIYAIDGTIVRTLALGHQPVGIYQDKSRAAYWDGRNGLGESVASGVYFYTLTSENFTATRKMLILK